MVCVTITVTLGTRGGFVSFIRRCTQTWKPMLNLHCGNLPTSHLLIIKNHCSARLQDFNLPEFGSLLLDSWHACWAVRVLAEGACLCGACLPGSHRHVEPATAAEPPDMQPVPKRAFRSVTVAAGSVGCRVRLVPLASHQKPACWMALIGSNSVWAVFSIVRKKRTEPT